MSAKQEWVKTLITALRDYNNYDRSYEFFTEDFFTTPQAARKYGAINHANWYEALHIAEAGSIDGSDSNTIVKFTHPDGCVCYVNFYGYYTSYDGANYENCCLVEPVQKVVTVYEERAVL